MNGAYEENKLLNRLFGSYRMSFVAGEGCSLDENDGKKLYAESPEQVPLEGYFKYFDLSSKLQTVSESVAVKKELTASQLRDTSFVVNLWISVWF